MANVLYVRMSLLIQKVINENVNSTFLYTTSGILKKWCCFFKRMLFDETWKAAIDA